MLLKRRPPAALFLTIYALLGAAIAAMVLTFETAGFGAYALIGGIALAALWYDRPIQYASIFIFAVCSLPTAFQLGAHHGLWYFAVFYGIGLLIELGLTELIHWQVQTNARLLRGEQDASAALRRAEGRLSRIVANSPLATYTLQLTGERIDRPARQKFTFVSANILDLTGYSEADFNADPELWLSRVPVEDRADVFDVDPDEASATREYRFKRRDGVEIWLEDRSRIMPATADSPVEIVGHVHDVTARKLAQLQAEESRRFNAQLAAAIPSQVNVLEADTLRILYVNHAPVLETAAKNPLDAIVPHLVDTRLSLTNVHPEDRATVLAALARVQTLADDSTEQTSLTIRSVNGDWRDLQVRYRVFKRDAEGSPTQILCVTDDVTEARRAERALADSQRLLGRITDVQPGVIYVLDLWANGGDGAFVYVNRYAPDLLGYRDLPAERRESVRVLFELMHPDDAGAAATDLGRVEHLADGETLERDFRMRAADGNWRWVRSRLLVFSRDTNGRPQHILGLLDDVTAMHQAHFELASSKRLFERVAEAVPSTLYVLDLRALDSSGGVAFANRSLPAQLGYAAGAAHLAGWEAFLKANLHPDDRELFIQARRAWLGLPDGEVLETEFRLKDAAGNWHWMRGRHLAFERDDAGVVTQVIGLIEDITAGKEMQLEIRSERDFATLVLNTLGQGVAVVNFDGRCEYVNPAGARIMGIAEDGLVGLFPREILPPALAAELHGRLRESLVTGVAVQFEFRYRRSDGADIDLLAAVTWRNQDGAPIGLVVVFTDVTEQKLLQHELSEKNRELEQALATARELTRVAQAATRAKSEFLANMSHEIRTPMNAIIGMAEVLQTTPLSNEQAGPVQIMVDSGQALLGIINDILDFSKIEAGRIELDLHPFDLAAVVESVVDLLSIRAREKGLRLMCCIDPALPPSLIGDAGRVRQILLNLVSNAVKFTAQGRVSVRVALESLTGSIAHVRLAVIDTGIGISPEAQSRLFLPFEQAEQSTTRRFGGTGLGLAIVKRLTELMGGEVAVNSQPDVGTTFSLRVALPVSAAGGLPIARPLSGRVLVIDPEPDSACLLTRFLQHTGLDVVAVEETTQPGARVRADGPFNLVVIGLWGDDSATLQCLTDLRADPVAGTLPRVVLTDGVVDSQAGDLMVPRTTKRAELRRVLEEALGALSSAPGLERVQRVPATIADRDRIVEGARVLLAEDNPVNQKVAVLQLEKLGFHVDIVGDGRAAIAAYEEDPDRYAVILMDCQMPVMDGFDATRAIRAWEQGQGAGRHVRVVAMTANAMAGDRELCLECGMDDYVSKPVARQTLEQVLHAARVGLTTEP